MATFAYVDSSCLVAVALGEPAGRRARAAFAGVDRLLSSNLLEAEVRAALAREGVAAGPETFAGIDWVLPERALGAEMERVSAAGLLRGADLWHVACALYLDPTAAELVFLTLDKRQRDVAAAAGFAVSL